MKSSHDNLPLFADVLLPLPVKGKFTYSVPSSLETSVIRGGRVIVQFGSRKVYSGLVSAIHNNPPAGYSAKEILGVLDETPVVNDLQLDFWKWLSTYYMCTEGEVMNAGLPSTLKLSSESSISLNPAAAVDPATLNEREYLIWETLNNRNKIAVSEVSKILELQKTLPLLKTMLEKGIIVMDEEISDKYREKTETFVELTPFYEADELHLKPIFDLLEKKAKKQLDLLMSFMILSGFGSSQTKPVTKIEVLKHSGSNSQALDSLIKKDVFRLVEKSLKKSEEDVVKSVGSILLTDAQQKAYEETISGFSGKDVVLLHGVTSSGKTEIYIKFISEAIERGEQVLFLLPEIALTTQIVSRLKKYFGEKVGVYHSRFNERERAEVWNNMLTGKGCDIILGARSAVFLPFTKLGLIIIDEEHDSSYKQSDPAPRYNGRDSALYLARLHGAKTILGSATPSVESYYNCRLGKYALVELLERYGNMELPAIEVVDIRKEMLQKKMSSHFSSVLIEQLKHALELKEQSIIFQNRRGFSLRVECETCNWMPSCKNCDVTLVYHKKRDLLLCHYCGYTVQIPSVCPECKGTSMRMKGFGTEKVEEELSAIFPDARIARMDLDTTRSRFAHQRMIDDLETHKIDILTGTQMVTKGLDFEKVSTVSILNADNMLSYPDFRSAERSFQLMSQVSGRSGRKNKQGTVIIQTYNPKNPVIKQVVEHDYKGMFEDQLLDRRQFRYPPFFRLIQLKVKHKDQKIVNRASEEFADELRKIFGNRVLGPEYPLVSRIMTWYIKQIMIKVEKNVSAADVKLKLSQCIDKFSAESEWRSARIIVDVDPQ